MSTFTIREPDISNAEALVVEADYEKDVATAAADPVMAQVTDEARQQIGDYDGLGTGGVAGGMNPDFVDDVARCYLAKALGITYINAAADAVARALTGVQRPAA